MSTVPVEIPNTALAAVPAALMAYQQRWVADDSPLKVIEKSRRTGLTWGEAADNVLTAAASRTAGGMNVYYIAYNQDMTVEYIQACAMWARVFNYAAGEIEEGFWDGEDEAGADDAMAMASALQDALEEFAATSDKIDEAGGGVDTSSPAAFTLQITPPGSKLTMLTCMSWRTSTGSTKRWVPHAPSVSGIGSIATSCSCTTNGSGTSIPSTRS